MVFAAKHLLISLKYEKGQVSWRGFIQTPASSALHCGVNAHLNDAVWLREDRLERVDGFARVGALIGELGVGASQHAAPVRAEGSTRSVGK